MHQSFHPPKVLLLDWWDLDYQPSTAQPLTQAYVRPNAGPPQLECGKILSSCHLQ